MVHDVDVEVVAAQVQRENPAGPLEEQIERLLVVLKFRCDVKEVLLTTQWAITVICE